MIQLTPQLDETESDPMYMQLYRYVKEEIQSQRITAGTRLPSKRKMAKHLQISLNTVDAAYQQLVAEGYLEAIPKKGFFVCRLESGPVGPPQSERGWEKRIRQKKRQAETPSYRYDFSYAEVDLDHFPFSTWRKLTNECLHPEHKTLLKMGDQQGEWGLREEIAAYLYQSRGVRCLPEQIVIGAGTPYMVGLLGRLLGTSPVYALEEPGYYHTRMALRDLGVKVVDIPLDQDGLDISELENADADVVYVTPSHQFPTGTIMPISRRMALLQWSGQQANRWVIEDDYDSEFRYTGKPIPALQSLDSEGRVIYLGTFSKALLPSMRMSYMVLPERLLETYDQHFNHYRQTVSRLQQKTLQLFMARGYWERHLNKMRVLYGKKQEILLSELQIMGDNIDVIGENSGLHILLKVHNGLSEKELLQVAGEHQVKVYPASTYYATAAPSEPTLLLGFAGLSETDIREAVRLLAKAWFP